MRNAIRKISENRVCMVLAVILLIAIYCLRIINLDQDLPAWGVGTYQAKDEACYAMLAINEWEYGTINPDTKEETGLDFPLYITEHMRINIIGNLLQIASFHIFGDNYYGLRMPMVLIGLVNLALMGLVMLELRKRYGKGSSGEIWAILGLLFLTAFHFYFYLSTRTVEPSTMRMVFAQAIMLVWLKSRKKGKLCFFLIGGMISLSVFLVYVTNVFLYLAAGLLLLMIWITDGWKAFLKNTAGFVLGVAVVFGISELYYQLVWGVSTVENMLLAVGNFSASAGYEISAGTATTMLLGFANGVKKFFTASFFLYSPGGLFLLFALLPLAVYILFKKRDKTLFFLLIVPASFLAQTMFVEDYIWRKLLVVAPYLIYFLYWAFADRQNIVDLLIRFRQWCAERKGWLSRILTKMIIPVYVMLAAGVVIWLVRYRLYTPTDPNIFDFTETDKLLLRNLGYLPVLLCSVWISVIWLFYKKLSFGKPMLVLGCAALLLSGSLLQQKVWSDPTYVERDMMISLSETYHLDGVYIIGDFSVGITLYNDLKPVFEYAPNYGLRLVENPEIRLFHYYHDEGYAMHYMRNVYFHTAPEYYPAVAYLLPNSMQVYGNFTPFAIYDDALYPPADPAQ